MRMQSRQHLNDPPTSLGGIRVPFGDFTDERAKSTTTAFAGTVTGSSKSVGGSARHRYLVRTGAS